MQGPQATKAQAVSQAQAAATSTPSQPQAVSQLQTPSHMQAAAAASPFDPNASAHGNGVATHHAMSLPGPPSTAAAAAAAKASTGAESRQRATAMVNGVAQSHSHSQAHVKRQKLVSPGHVYFQGSGSEFDSGSGSDSPREGTAEQGVTPEAAHGFAAHARGQNGTHQAESNRQAESTLQAESTHRAESHQQQRQHRKSSKGKQHHILQHKAGATCIGPHTATKATAASPRNAQGLCNGVESSAGPKVPSTDAEVRKLPMLTGEPVEGDIVSYKLLEIGEDWSPQVCYCAAVCQLVALTAFWAGTAFSRRLCDLQALMLATTGTLLGSYLSQRCLQVSEYRHGKVASVDAQTNSVVIVPWPCITAGTHTRRDASLHDTKEQEEEEEGDLTPLLSVPKMMLS